MSSAKIHARPEKDTVYVDVDDEITAIIDKVEGAKNKIVALVLPKRSTVMQSVVNMRLLKRSADKAGKDVVLITNEEALLPLAGMVGLHVAKNLQSKPEVPAAAAGSTPSVAKVAATGAAAGAAAIAIKKGVEVEEHDTPEDPDAALDGETKLDYHRSIGELATAHEVTDDESIDLEDEDEEQAAEDTPKKAKKAKGSKVKVPNFDRFRLMMLALIGVFTLLIVGIIFALFVLPKATIIITTESSTVNASLTVTASDSVKTVDVKTNSIPASSQTTQQTASQQVPATGQQNNGTKATGSVAMTAQKCSGNLFVPPDPVAAGTGVSSGGQTYILQQSASFHGTSTSGSCASYATSGSTGITAVANGAKYNVSSASFTVPGRSDVSASGSASGGTDSIVTVVSQSDVDNASAKLTGADNTAFTKDFQTKLEAQGYYVVTSTLKAETPTVTASPDVGQQASTTTVNTQIKYSVLVVKKADLETLVTNALTKQIDPKKQKLSDEDVLKNATVTVQNQSSPTTATLSVAASATAVPIIDPNAIKQQAVGQKVGDIEAAINSQPGVKNVNVYLSPFWVSKAPKASKITVIMKQATSSTKNDSSGG